MNRAKERDCLCTTTSVRLIAPRFKLTLRVLRQAQLENVALKRALLRGMVSRAILTSCR